MFVSVTTPTIIDHCTTLESKMLVDKAIDNPSGRDCSFSFYFSCSRGVYRGLITFMWVPSSSTVSDTTNISMWWCLVSHPNPRAETWSFVAYLFTSLNSSSMHHILNYSVFTWNSHCSEGACASVKEERRGELAVPSTVAARSDDTYRSTRGLSQPAFRACCENPR